MIKQLATRRKRHSFWQKPRRRKGLRHKGCVVDVNQVTGISDVVKSGTEVYHTSTNYDSKGRVASSTDAYGNTTKYEYDNFDRQVKVTQANGLITETVYNTKGQVWKSIIQNGNDIRTTEYKYDEFGNIIETIQPDGTSIKAEYNNKGQKISETNQLGQTRYFEYDDNGQLMSVTLPAVNGKAPVYKYTYDAQGNQLTIEDPNGNVTSFTYDINGNQTSRTLPDKSVETFEYDVKGRLVKQTSFEGVITEYKYDKYDRLVSKTFTQNGKSEIWTYFYDSFGRVEKINQAGRITETKYTPQGQIEKVITPEGTITYTYDEFGRQKSVQTDNDTPIEYDYDNFGRLIQVKSGDEKTNYAYDAFGNLIQTVTKTGSQTLAVKYVYDNMNRLKTLTNYVDANNDGYLANNERVSQFDYFLDWLGRKDNAVETFWIDGFENKNLIDWNYDNAGRLIQEVFDHYDNAFDQTQEWEYDLVGNRLVQKLDKGNDGIYEAITSYTYDTNDRLITELFDDLTEENKDKTTVYGYTSTQQTSKSVSENGTIVSETTFEYDAQGRMSVVTIVSGNRIEKTIYEYGADGIRVSAEHTVSENGSVISHTKTEYLNDSQNITGYSQVLKQTETDIVSGEEKITTYVIGHQRISQTVKENNETKEYYFTFDGHGSTRVLLNAACAVAQIYSFDAYGNALGFNSAEALTEFLYSGEQFDSKIGQQYLRARYYDPATGRFNMLDPFFGNISDPQSLHKYTYAHNDPISMTDPSGRMGALGVAISIGIGGVVGGISGGTYGSIRYGFGTAGMWRSTAIGFGVGAMVGFAVGGGISAIFFGKGLILSGNTVISAKGLVYLSAFMFTSNVFYLRHAIGGDNIEMKVTTYSSDEAEYLGKLIDMMCKASHTAGVDNDARYLYKGYFIGRSMNVVPGDTDSYETSYAVGRYWTFGGKAIILSNDFFVRKSPGRGTPQVAFASQVETLFHETYHHGSNFYKDYPEDPKRTVIKFADKMRQSIENTPEYQDFFNNVYLPYVANH